MPNSCRMILYALKGDQRMKKNRLLILMAAILASAVTSFAGTLDVIGTWEGNLQVGGQALPLVFHIEGNAKEGWHATMDSPKQQAFGIPVNKVEWDGNILTLVSEAVRGTFTGKPTAEGKLAGEWKQGGQSFPLTLTKSDRKPEPPSETDQKQMDTIKQLFTMESGYAELFHESFLKQVPEKEVVRILKMYKDKLGMLKSIKGANGSYTLFFEKGQAPCKISLTQEGLIQGLWFGNYTLTDADPNQTMNKLKRLDGDISVTVTRNNQPLFQYRSDRPMAVGSAFKLYILKALTDKVNRGELTWDQTIPIRAAYKSLPSGMLQNWPDGTPMTLQSLAHLMISISDNTATDHLLHFLGRKTVEAVAPETMHPFLSTAEMFRLKWGGREDLLHAFVSGDTETRRRILNRTHEIPLNTLRIDMSKPAYVDSVEWLVSTEDLCRLIFELRMNPSLSINPGLASPDMWGKIGFKGGSEQGVLNYTHMVQKTADSPVYCISATLNTPDKVDTGLTDTFTSLVTELISSLNTTD